MIGNELKRLRNACTYSWSGIWLSWKDAGAFRLEICLTPVVVVSAICMTDGNTDLALVLATWFFVLLTELLNTAIEAVTDLACGGNYHALAKKAKDCGSAAVTIALVAFAVCCAIIFFS